MPIPHNQIQTSRDQNTMFFSYRWLDFNIRYSNLPRPLYRPLHAVSRILAIWNTKLRISADKFKALLWYTLTYHCTIFDLIVWIKNCINIVPNYHRSPYVVFVLWYSSNTARYKILVVWTKKLPCLTLTRIVDFVKEPVGFFEIFIHIADD